MSKPFRPLADAPGFARGVRSRLNIEAEADGDEAGNEAGVDRAIERAPAFGSPAAWRPALLFAIRPAAPQGEASATSSIDATRDSGVGSQPGITPRHAKTVDANAVAARVYDLMREEARLAKMRGAWSGRRRTE